MGFEDKQTGGSGKTDACPWDLESSKTVANYKEIGVAIELDCTDLTADGGVSYQYTKEDLSTTLRSLDDAFEIVTKSARKPARFRLAKKALHDSKNNFIQLLLGDNTFSRDVPHFIDVTLRLMELEQVEFGNQVRFSYSELAKIRDSAGKRKDVGAHAMFAPPEEYVSRDFVALKKFKDEILEHKEFFPDVVLFHGNDLSFFQTNIWNSNYFFTAEVDDVENKKFFDFLSNYEKLMKSYAPTELDLDVHRSSWTGYKADFEKTNKLLDIGVSIRSALQDKNLKKVTLRGRQGSSRTDDEFIILQLDRSQQLTLTNVFDSLDNPLDPKAVVTCISAQDYSNPYYVKCPVDPR